MKKIAILTILFGSGLVAFGVSGFSGEFSSNTRFSSDGSPYSGSFGWSMNERIEIVVGVAMLAGGLILRRDAKLG
jgi:hypothetical protein